MKTAFLTALYVSLFTVGPILSGQKVIAGIVPAGMFTGCIAYGLIDVLNNASGKKNVAKIVDTAVVARAIVYGLIFLIALAPPASKFPAEVRVFLATTVSMWVAMRVVAIPGFDWLRRKLRAGFWARYNLTNLPAQTVALLIWVPLAYIGTGRDILPIILGGFIVRILMSVSLTPLFSALARWAGVVAVVAFLLLIAGPAQATDLFKVGEYDLKFNNRLTVLATDSSLLRYRLEDNVGFRWWNLYTRNRFFWHGNGFDYTSNYKWENQLTVGCEIIWGIAPVYQWAINGNQQLSRGNYVTSMVSINRIGLEWIIK